MKPGSTRAYLGDTLFEAVYSDYKDFGGIKFPMKIVQRQGGFPIFDLTVSGREAQCRRLDPAAAGARRRARRSGATGRRAAAAVPTEKLADGVFLILGGYASVAVDFRDYIVVIEGPQSEQRAMQIIDDGEAVDSRQANSLRRQHASPLRSLERPSNVCRGGRNRRDSRSEQAVLREAVCLAAHAGARSAAAGEARAEVRDDDAKRRC